MRGSIDPVKTLVSKKDVVACKRDEDADADEEEEDEDEEEDEANGKAKENAEFSG